MLPLENHPYDELTIGQARTIARDITRRDAGLLAVAAGGADGAAWAGLALAMASAARFPGPGTVPLGTELNFAAPVAVGDTIATCLTVREKRPLCVVVLDCVAVNQKDELVVSGTFTVRAPLEKRRLAGRA